mgnify:FL=1
MKNFIFAAISFVIIGISIAIIAANSKKTKESRISEGMCLGMSFGLLVSTLIPSEYMGMCLSIGMIVGEAIGSYIKK